MKPTLALSLALLLSGTAAIAQETQNQPGDAAANFINTDGVEAGYVQLSQTEDGVNLSGEITGIAEGEHGVHIHETGDCAADGAFESAGGHFNPGGNKHGLDNPEGPHAGDMANQIAGADASMTIEITNDSVSLIEGEEGYLFDEDGSAIVVHSGPDDQMTDPGGNSGDRVACAVIEPIRLLTE